ncbi:MAG: hypothetical protein J0I06_23250 [Planctomycetes bacterium]|nr:hypothetical protein [Planctomycetota bacterium]
MTTTPVISHPRFLPFFLVALAARFGTIALGLVLATVPPDPYSDPETPTRVRDEIRTGSARLIEPWYRFDATWYADVARRGYAGSQGRNGQLGVAFMPALPATMAAADALGLNMFWVGLLTTNLAGAVGTAVLARVAARQLGDPAAGWGTLALFLAFPTAFFCSAPYNESFGLLFAALTLAAWQANRPVVAGVCAFGGSLARLTGVAFGIAAVVDWFTARDRSTLRRALWVTIGSFAGVAAFWGFLWWAVGDPLANLKAHRSWGRPDLSWKNPLRTIESINDPLVPHRWEAVVVLGATILGVRAWRKRGAFWGLVALVPVAQMFASGTLLSAHRIILAALPAFIELADLLRGRRVLLCATLLVFAYAQLTLVNRFVHWQFAG